MNAALTLLCDHSSAGANRGWPVFRPPAAGRGMQIAGNPPARGRAGSMVAGLFFPFCPLPCRCRRAKKSQGNWRSRSVAQPGSALDWGSRGRGFESRRSDHLPILFKAGGRDDLWPAFHMGAVFPKPVATPCQRERSSATMPGKQAFPSIDKKTGMPCPPLP